MGQRKILCLWCTAAARATWLAILALPLVVVDLPGTFHGMGGAVDLNAVLAAAGLVIIMIGATAITVASGDVGPALVPLVVGILSTIVTYGRRN